MTSKTSASKSLVLHAEGELRPFGAKAHTSAHPIWLLTRVLSEDFRDLCDAWQAFGKPALETMAMLYPVEFVRLAASLMPKEPEATITPVVMKRMSDAQLDALIAR